MELNYEQLNRKLLEKQKLISEKSLQIEDLRWAYDTAKKDFEVTSARIELSIENNNPNMAEGKIIRRAKSNTEYELAWAKFIVAKSKFKKAEMELSVLHDEIKTLELAGNNLSRESKLARYS